MSSFGGPTISGNRCFEPADDPIGVVHRKRRLREIRQLCAGREFEPIDLLGRFDEHERLGRFAHRADHFVVPLRGR